MARPTILCVDDERSVLVSLKEQLRRRFGKTLLVETCESGETALELLEELDEEGAEVPVVISDHIMPGLKGDELLGRIEAQWPSIIKIMLTGQASAEAVGSALNQARLFRYLTKPWDEPDLGMTVQAALDRFENSQRLAEHQATLRELNQLAIDLTSTLATRHRYDRLVERISEAFGADRVALFALRGDRLRRQAASSDRPDDTSRRLGNQEGSPIREALDSPSPTRCRPSTDCTTLAGDIGWEDLRGGVIAVGLRAAGEQVGVLALGFQSPNVFRRASDERVTAFAALAAASMRTGGLIDALEAARDQQRQVAQTLLRDADLRSAGPMQGDSAAIQGARAALEGLAGRAKPLLLLGAPGTGKEAAARYVHRCGPRAEAPFLMLTGATVQEPEELGRAGSAFRVAQGGTLYISAADRLGRGAQRTLSATLTSEDRPDVRVILSTSRDGGQRWVDAVLDPSLRACIPDQVQLPLLSQRQGDIETLAAFYLQSHASRLGRPAEAFEPEAVARLAAYHWPGNVRELERVVERAVLTGTGTQISIDQALADTSASVGSYQLIEILGAGGMGEVWRAKHQHLSRWAAVKLIKSSKLWSAQAMELAVHRFRREAGAISGLRSPHTVELYDFGVSDTGELFYVMELLDGVDLQTLVEKHGALPPERVVRLLHQACHSLLEAHEAGLVHRDIKAANLVSCRLGPDRDFLKVLDFGMVTSEQDKRLTAPGYLAGTANTAAPESLRGDADARSDLYSLGCVAYQLLTGRDVFLSPMPQLFMDHLQTTPDPVQDHAPHPVPPALAELVHACLEKEADDRPQSARALRRALGELELADPWTEDRAAQWWQTHRD